VVGLVPPRGIDLDRGSIEETKEENGWGID
jgi:hypothetical protein